ncbi:hypothetical protein GJ744_004051 [Endocarpon pusillum]|uniref:Carrier domain-containing protein n=1 Tax=Endocarpon pusillum TaxID=364733 RepID=A0A8H7DZD6_9EURO|nr:hypothetical protein GJ744_004051 [Endocarpon pusillum]
MPHSLRSAYIGNSIQCIADSLEKDLAQGSPVHATREERSPVVFLFTGQGSHYAGMGRDLFNTSPAFRTAILKLHRICEKHGFSSFLELITDPSIEIENISSVQIHLALVSVEIALVDLWKAWGIEPDAVIGHSIGEYAALYTAGVLSANDVMYLVGKRAELIDYKCVAGTHGMLSIAAAPNQLDTILSNLEQDNLQISCFNCPNMAVLSGERPQLLQVKERLEEQRVKCKLLDVQYAMHSTQLDGITEGFRRVAQGVRFGAPKVKIVSTLLGDEIAEDNDHVFNGDYLVRHSKEPVQFQRAIETCKSRHLVDPSAFWLEIGPRPICLGLVRSNLGSIPFDHAFASLDKGVNSWKCVSAALAAMYKARKPVQWREFHRDFVDCLSLISLPKYAWDTKDFWIPYQGSIQLPDSQQVTATESQLLSTCLHHIERHEDTAEGQSATFTSKISHPSLMDIIRGHRLSGITVCPAGVFNDMALTAARYMLTGEASNGPFPNLSVVSTQIDRPIVPQPNSSQVVEVNVTRSRTSPDSFSVSFTDQVQPSATISKCIVQVRDEVAFHLGCQGLLPSIQSKIAMLKKNAEAGRANRFMREIFYKLFGDLMSYDDKFEGVEEAVVSQNFDEAVATVKVLAHDATKPDGRFTLSPYWIDALTHLAGFLFNGNPLKGEDYVYMGTHMERLEIAARDLSPDVRYQSYAYIERSRGSDILQGHVYILDGDLIVGYLEGARFRRMPRNTLHRVLGKIEPSTSNRSLLGRYPADSSGITKVTNGPVETPKEAPKSANGESNSYYATFLKILLHETGLVESELQPSTFFAEIGIDSLMSISVLAALKAETGLELPATWLMEQPTLQDAQREFRSIQSRTAGTSLPNGTISTSTDSHQGEHHETQLDGHTATNGVAINGVDTTNGCHETEGDSVFSNGTRIGNGAVANGHHIKFEESRSCNIVLMQGSATPSPRLPLFLIADGAGSAAAYLHLPKLGHDLPVWAVESPWVHDPENFDCSFQEAVAFYLAAVRAKQPHGPYLLGGWSAGGVFAYEVARLLLEAGEQVKALVIVDIPGPRAYDRTKVVEPTMNIIDELGMLTGIDRSYSESTPKSQHLKRHMLSTVTCLSKLDPIAMRPECQPDHVFIICATKDILPRTPHGGCGGDVGNSAASKLNAWFYPSSYGIGPRGWDALVGDGNLEYFAVEGDHFSIMLPPEVSQLGQIIQKALGTSSQRPCPYSGLHKSNIPTIALKPRRYTPLGRIKHGIRKGHWELDLDASDYSWCWYV